jgi:Bacterial regulatory proteins, gntR family
LGWSWPAPCSTIRTLRPGSACSLAILRDRIESGEIGPDEPPPSITFLAQETGLAVGTVCKAIKVLADEGSW